MRYIYAAIAAVLLIAVANLPSAQNRTVRQPVMTDNDGLLLPPHDTFFDVNSNALNRAISPIPLAVTRTQLGNATNELYQVLTNDIATTSNSLTASVNDLYNSKATVDYVNGAIGANTAGLESTINDTRMDLEATIAGLASTNWPVSQISGLNEWMISGVGDIETAGHVYADSIDANTLIGALDASWLRGSGSLSSLAATNIAAGSNGVIVLQTPVSQASPNTTNLLKDVDWTLGTGWAKTNGYFVHTAGQTAGITNFPSGYPSGALVIQVAVTNYASGWLTIQSGGWGPGWYSDATNTFDPYDGFVQQFLYTGGNPVIEALAVYPSSDWVGNLTVTLHSLVPATPAFAAKVPGQSANFLEIRGSDTPKPNLFIGTDSGGNAFGASGNSGFGRQSFWKLTTGQENSGFGNAVLRSLTSGSYNTAVGASAAYNVSTGSNNTAVGFSAGYANGSSNTVVGYMAMGSSAGNGVTALGHKAGYSASGDIYTTYIGTDSGRSGSAKSNAIAIGYNAKVDESNAMQVGATNAGQQVKLNVTGGAIDLKIGTNTYAAKAGWARISADTNGTVVVSTNLQVAGGITAGSTQTVEAGYLRGQYRVRSQLYSPWLNETNMVIGDTTPIHSIALKSTNTYTSGSLVVSNTITSLGGFIGDGSLITNVSLKDGSTVNYLTATGSGSNTPSLIAKGQAANETTSIFKVTDSASAQVMNVHKNGIVFNKGVTISGAGISASTFAGSGAGLTGVKANSIANMASGNEYILSVVGGPTSGGGGTDVTVSWSTLAAFAVTTASATCTGAQTGDFVFITPTGGSVVSSCDWDAYVSSSDVIVVRVRNVSSGSIGSGSMTFRVVVCRMPLPTPI